MSPSRLFLAQYRNSSKAALFSSKASRYLPLFAGTEPPYTFDRKLTERGPNIPANARSIGPNSWTDLTETKEIFLTELTELLLTR